MASRSREGRPYGSRPPPWVSSGGSWEAVESVPVGRPPSQRLLEQLLGDMQSHLSEMERMRRALLDAYPVFWARSGACAAARPERVDPPAFADDVASGGGGYSFSLDVAGFAPEELSVQVQGRRVRVCAKRDRRSEAADGCISHEYREVRKELVLPADADPEAVACDLEGGLLCVRAPRLAPAEPPPPRTVPISVAGAPDDSAEKKASADTPEVEKQQPEGAGAAAAP